MVSAGSTPICSREGSCWLPWENSWEGSQVGRPVRKGVLADPRIMSRESPLLSSLLAEAVSWSHHELPESKQSRWLAFQSHRARQPPSAWGPGPHTCMNQPHSGGWQCRAGAQNPESRDRPVTWGKSLGNRSGTLNREAEGDSLGVKEGTVKACAFTLFFVLLFLIVVKYT